MATKPYAPTMDREDIRDVREDFRLLWDIFPEHSRTYSLATERLRETAPFEADVLMIEYSLCRLVDCLEDFPLDENRKRDYEKKGSLSYLFLDSLEKRDQRMAESVTTFLRDVPVDKEGYDKLILHTPNLARAFQSLPPRIQNSSLRHLCDMIEGFSNPQIQKIGTLNDLVRYCEFAASIPGYMITDLFDYMGHFSHLPGTQKSEMWALAHDFGIALQITNNLKDTKEDIENDKPRWPLQLIKKYSISSYDELTNPKKWDKIRAALDEHIKIVKPYYESSLRYIDNLSSEPIGLRIYCGNPLCWSAATIRQLQNPQIFFSEGSKISRKEVRTIDSIVTDLTKRKKSLRNFVNHLLEKSAKSYKLED